MLFGQGIFKEISIIEFH